MNVTTHLIYRDNDMPCFVSSFNIPVRFNNLFKRIASNDNRYNLSGLDPLFEKEQIFR